jgi:hypothetical protein
LIGASERGPCGLNTRFAGRQCDDDQIALLPRRPSLMRESDVLVAARGRVRCAPATRPGNSNRAAAVHGLGIELRREPLDPISIQDMRCEDTLVKRLPLTSIMMIVIFEA